MPAVGAVVRRTREALGLKAITVAEAVDLEVPALLRYESGEQELPGEVEWRLSDVLGVPFEELEDPRSFERFVGSLAVRFRADTRGLSEEVRLAVARASGAARGYLELEELAGMRSRYRNLLSEFPGKQPVSRARPAWEDGRDLAAQLRHRLGQQGPTTSMIELVEGLGILILWQELSKDIAGYALCDELHGPTIVLNVFGRNVNELVRRFTLAHELCHVLFDRDDLEHMSSFDRYDDFDSYRDERSDPRESRANAFAIHLLAPAENFVGAWRQYGDVRRLMTIFGISYQAARHHLDNYGLLPFDERIDVATTAPDEWKNTEGHELWYPGFGIVPLERRHSVAKLAFSLWRQGQITENRLREVLGNSLSLESKRFGHEKVLELAELYGETPP